MCQQQIRTSSGNLKGSLSAISAIEPIMTSARRPMSAQRSSMLRSSAKESIRHMAALGPHIHASTKNSEVSPRYCRIYASMISPTEHPLLCASSRSRLPPRFPTFDSIIKTQTCILFKRLCTNRHEKRVFSCKVRILLTLLTNFLTQFFDLRSKE